MVIASPCLQYPARLGGLCNDLSLSLTLLRLVLVQASDVALAIVLAVTATGISLRSNWLLASWRILTQADSASWNHAEAGWPAGLEAGMGYGWRKD